MRRPKIETALPQRVRLRANWQRAEHPDPPDLCGTYFGRILIKQWWAMVLWDDEEDPTFFKFAGLEFFTEDKSR